MNDSEEKPKKSQGELPDFKTNKDLLMFLFVLIRENRKWWLLPFLFVLGFLGLFVGLTGNTTMLPAIYALF